MPKLQCFALI